MAKMAKAKTNKEKTRVAHREKAAMKLAVRKQMPVHKYMEVAEIIRQNTAVRRQFMKILHTEQQQAPSKATG